jgi:hypothetical protein
MYKFPHEEDWTHVEFDHDSQQSLQHQRFHWCLVVEQYKMLKRDKRAVRMVEEAMTGKEE